MLFRKIEKGFTLIEVIVTMVVVGIVAVILTNTIVSISQVLATNRMSKQLLMEGYNGTSRFVREFEQVSHESRLIIGESSRIQFIPTIVSNTPTITYRIFNGQLQRNVNGGAWDILCNNVTGQFQYFNQQFVELLPSPLNGGQLLLTRHVRLRINMLDTAGTIQYTYVIDVFPDNYRFAGGGS